MAAKYVRTCASCQKYTSREQAATGKMHATHVDQPWEMISTHLNGPLPRSTTGHTCLLVIQGRFTKWIELRPLKKATGKAVLEAGRVQICLRHGCPDVIVTDNGRQFTSNEFREFLSASNIRHRSSLPYTLKCNPLEKANWVIKTMIAQNVSKNHKTWGKYIRELAFAYNMAQHESNVHTSAYLNFGRELKSPRTYTDLTFYCIFLFLWILS